MTFFSTGLGDLLSLPATLLFYAGLSLFPVSAFLLYVATRRKTAAPFVWAIVFGNTLWTLDSILILLTGWVTPNASGLYFVVFQAAGVALFVGLEFIGLKRSQPETAAAFQHS
jgi:CHASE2 domain-containing sensor protein